MSNGITFTIPFSVVGKQRPRKGKHGFYTPAETQRCERDIKFIALARTNATPAVRFPLDGSIAVEIGFPPSRADLDNQTKTIGDALNGILYRDDRQIVELRVTRIAGTDTTVKVTEVSGGNKKRTGKAKGNRGSSS